MSRARRHVTLDNPTPTDGRQKPKFWTLEKQWRLTEYLERGLSDTEIAARFGVSVDAVILARKDYGIRARSRMHLSARRVAQIMGFSEDGKAVTTWIKRGWLRAHRVPRGQYGQHAIRYNHLIAFLEDPAHHHRWQPERITDPALRAWATTIWRGPYLTVGQVAWRLCVDRGTVNTWIQRGLLPSARHGNHLIREADLDGFIVPSHIPRTGRIRDWTASEDRTVLAMRAEGASWTEIGHVLDRWPSVCNKRWHTLTAEQEAA